MKLLLPFLATLIAAAAPHGSGPVADDAGSLRVIDREGHPNAHCPLKRTEVKASISGFLSRVTVTQHFENPLNERIEAVYTFPLPQNAAVDDMTMLVGDRVVKGKIKPREEAKAIYDAARHAGRTASLLEQERPNIFTQSVANIRPGEKVKITISYVETLRYEAGSYEFVFPMVVGPRYIPGKATGRSGGGWAPDTSRVPDGSRISPQVTPEGTRAGHDITVEVALDAGVPIDILRCTSHDVATERPDARRATVKLKNLATIPNKDFVLQYDVAGRKIEDAVLTHRGGKGGFFSLILQPPDRVAPAEITPRELIFVLDTSGSMSGFPIEKSKEVMRMALASMHPRDTFNIITFAGDTHILFPQPVAANAENVERARQFVEGRRGGGGTEMMKAIRAALEPTRSQEHLRVVAFLTDGYVGNDMEIIAEVKKYSNARVFSFGIGSSVNRFLLDKMAEHGRGEVEYVTLNADGSAAAKRFYERMRDPLLTDIRVEWNGLPVNDVYPKRVPDLFAAKPMVIHGRFSAAAKGMVKIYAKSAGREISRTIQLDLPAAQPANDVLASLWARTKIEDLTSLDYAGVQRGTVSHELRNEITKLGLDFKLMTQFTAFVAVEERMVSEGGGAPRRIEVPVEMPEGVSYQGVFGERRAANMPVMAQTMAKSQMAATPGIVGGVIGGMAPPPASPRIMMEDRSRDAREPEAKEKDALSKLHPTLVSAFAMQPGAVAKVKVYVAGDFNAAAKVLLALGVEIVKQNTTEGYMLVRTTNGKLPLISKLSQVRYVSPSE
ncbi:MAG: VWA domain-containing protein [Acidobacteria bacterium]|nr:VWA domain-containing protein [Acidobacteriota bacterium]